MVKPAGCNWGEEFPKFPVTPRDGHSVITVAQGHMTNHSPDDHFWERRDSALDNFLEKASLFTGRR